MNLDDLTDVLRERAELPADAAHSPRMSGVQARVRASRRRRVTTVAACLVAVLGVAFALALPFQRESQPAEPVFTEYHEGTRIVAQALGRAPETTITLRFVPNTPDARLFFVCETPDKQLFATLTINGRANGGFTCSSQVVMPIDWADEGVAIGAPTTIVMSVGEQIKVSQNEFKAGPMLPDSTFALALGQQVAPEDYPFPPRPETLAPVRDMGELPNSSTPEGTLLMRADPDQPNGTWQTTTTMPIERVDISAASNTPGRIRVLVNDVEVLDYAEWDYESGSGSSRWRDFWEESFGLKLEPDATVTITVIAERTTGDWGVWLVQW